jgi:hypothetical protein
MMRKEYFYIVIALVLFCVGVGLQVPQAHASINLIQATTSPESYLGGAGTTTVTFASNTTAGDLIVVTVGGAGNSSYSTGTISDTEGDTFNLVTSTNCGCSGDYFVSAQYYAANIHGGSDAVSFHWNSTDWNSLSISEFSGVSATSPLDQWSVSSTNGGTSVMTGTSTTTSANELLYSSMVGVLSTSTGVSSGWTWASDQTTGNIADGNAYEIVSSTGSYSNTFSPIPAYTGAIAYIATFKAATPTVTWLEGTAGSNGFGGTSQSTAFSSNVTTGATLIGLVQWYMTSANASDTISSVTDTRGNTWNIVSSTLTRQLNTSNYGEVASEIVYATDTAAGADTVTVNWAGATNGDFLSLMEVTSSTLDRTSNATGTSATPSAGTVTTNQNGEFGAAVSIQDDGQGNGNVYSAGSGWHLQTNTGGGNADEGTESSTQTTAGSLTGNFSVSNPGGSTYWAAAMATFCPGWSACFTGSAPSISSVSSSPGTTTATITWTTSPAADSLVNYGTSTSYTNSSTYSSSYVTSHSVNLTGLTASTTYHYQVVSSDSSVTTSSDYTFTTIATSGGSIQTGNGNVWVADTNNNRIEELSATGTYEGQIGCSSGACSTGSGSGQLNGPRGVAIDSSGNIWVTDYGNSRVEEFSSAGTYESMIGPSFDGGAYSFDEPHGIAIDSSGNIWVTDFGNNVVYEFSSAGSYLSQLGSGGTGEGQFDHPTGIAFDASGNIWVADYGQNRVQEFSASTTWIKQVGCSGSSACSSSDASGTFWGPLGIAFDASGDLWVNDSNNARIEELSATDTYKGQIGQSFDGGTYSFFEPQAGIAFDASGDLWVTDASEDFLAEFSSTSTFKDLYGASGTTNGQFSGPESIAIIGGFKPWSAAGIQAGNGNIWVVDGGNNRVEEYSATGTYEGQLGCSSGTCSTGSGNGQFNGPSQIAVDSGGNIWVTDFYNNRVQVFSATGTYEFQFGSSASFNGTGPIAINSSGDAWVGTDYDVTYNEYSATGTYMMRQFGGSGTANGEFGGNTGGANMAIDSSGNLWIGDDENSRVEEFSATGTYEGQLGCTSGACTPGSSNGELGFGPNSVAADASGNIWVGDVANYRIEEFSATGTYLGQLGCTSGGCSSGSGNGEFDNTQGIAVDASGNIWVVDGGNNRVEEFSATGTYEGQLGCASGGCSAGSGNGQLNGPGAMAIVGGNGYTNISASSLQHWAWNDDIGWLDFYDTRNIVVSSAKLTGYASSSAGDISLDCATSPRGNICGTSDYGVSNDGSGNLAGWAWNDAYGWISFCGNNSGGGSTLSGSTWVCPSGSTYQVVINPTTGVFSGWAWNDTLGWISFNCSNTSSCTGSSTYDVVTTWTGTGTAATGTLDSETFDTGVSSGAQLNSVTWEGSAPSSTAVGFQFAVSSSSSPGSWSFAGPDGTSATTYTGVAGVPIPLTDYPVLQGRYFRYRVILSTNPLGTATPRVTGIQVNWSK